MAEVLTNLATTTLSNNLTSGGLSASVLSDAGFPLTGNFRIRIGNELIVVTNPSGSDVFGGLQRGAEGTTAAPHSTGDAVRHVFTAAGLDTFVDERVGGTLGEPLATLATMDDPHATTYVQATDWGLALLYDNDAGESKSALGLDQVNNTPDTGKPVSTAQAAAINTVTRNPVNAATYDVATLDIHKCVDSTFNGAATISIKPAAFGGPTIPNGQWFEVRNSGLAGIKTLAWTGTVKVRDPVTGTEISPGSLTVAKYETIRLYSQGSDTYTIAWRSPSTAATVLDLKKDFGATGDPAGDDTAAWTAAINALNAGNLTLTVPVGTYIITSLLPTITGSNVRIVGAGYGTYLRIPSTSSLGTFFTIGDDAIGINVQGRVMIDHMTLDCQNITPTTHAFMLTCVNDVLITHLRVNGIAGLARIGETIRCARVNFAEITGNWRNERNVDVILIRAGVTLRFHRLELQDANAATSGSYIRVDARTNCDSAWFTDCEIYSTGGRPFGIKLDSTNGQIVNYWFTNVTHDSTTTAAVQCTATANANALRFAHFVNCRFATTTGRAVHITGTGTGDQSTIKFIGCAFMYADTEGVTVARGRDIAFVGCTILDKDVTVNKSAAMLFSVGAFRVVGCYFGKHGDEGAMNTNYAVRTNADVLSFTVVGNHAKGHLIDFFDHYNYAPPASIARVTSDNLGTTAADTRYIRIAATTPAAFSPTHYVRLKDSSGVLFYIPAALNPW